ncbi:ArsR/SmtB family transcription factor [Arthrobacter koreensis]|uniref:Helix-turn-helix domain-containing protein n=1 Tax=Arthrobacter koreensis TaxID=199136 RepID=A0ABY6FPG2_9MICC|nr:metalloregulator ArsR/SmtB family transcription factor [Arthrobacter koreensis]UYB34854.1 helix-turn-helix domain-containing protein [Arthrobacter koreensis]
MDAVFRALADPVRRILLEELASQAGQTLYELCVRLMSNHAIGITRQGVSKHLAVLESAGLVRVEADGRYRRHHLCPEPLTLGVAGWIGTLELPLPPRQPERNEAEGPEP